MARDAEREACECCEPLVARDSPRLMKLIWSVFLMALPQREATIRVMQSFISSEPLACLLTYVS